MKLYDFKVLNAQHESTTLKPYQGQVMLIVNTATKCGHTPQYEGLQKLYDTYQDKGFVILDFPCNQFLGQAPGKIEQIKAFCELNYQTTFPLFDKVKVNGFFTHPLYRYLKENAPKGLKAGNEPIASEVSRRASKRIKWNFTKFLIDRKGEIRNRFEPNFQPDDIASYIEALL